MCFVAYVNLTFMSCKTEWSLINILSCLVLVIDIYIPVRLAFIRLRPASVVWLPALIYEVNKCGRQLS